MDGLFVFLRSVAAQVVAYFVCEGLESWLNDRDSKH